MARFEEADPIAVWVGEIRLPPQPRSISRFLIKSEPGELKLLNRLVEVFTLEVEDRAVGDPHIFADVDRQR